MNLTSLPKVLRIGPLARVGAPQVTAPWLPAPQGPGQIQCSTNWKANGRTNEDFGKGNSQLSPTHSWKCFISIRHLSTDQMMLWNAIRPTAGFEWEDSICHLGGRMSNLTELLSANRNWPIQNPPAQAGKWPMIVNRFVDAALHHIHQIKLFQCDFILKTTWSKYNFIQ